MKNNMHIRRALDRLKRSRWTGIIGVALSFAVIIAVVYFKIQPKPRPNYNQYSSVAHIEDPYGSVVVERTPIDSIREVEERRRRMIEDSIRVANMPKYSLDEVEAMVTARVPSYSWIYLWRKDNDNWIMRYKREYGGKEHWFMQRFNPTTRKFEKAIEYATVYYPCADCDAVYSEPKNVRCSFRENSRLGTLTYYEDDEYMGIYDRKDIEHYCRIPSTTISPLAQQRINTLRSAPPDWADDGYESAEDYFYDNAEDLYFYYNGEY